MRTLFLMLLFVQNCFAQIDYTEYNKLLKGHVSAKGVVDYKGLKLKSKAIDNILINWSKLKLSSLPKNDQLAYYINVYNLSTINLIIKNYPLKSIQAIQKGKPWDFTFINIEGKNYTLNQIENNIVRPIYKDARIHFALNCGAISCPPLHNEAFTGSNLNAKLDLLTKTFINNKEANSVSNTEIKVSKLFDWYKDDFGDLTKFLSKYITVPNPKLKPVYNEYNWALNGK
jgi:hypothetical protein